MPSRVSPARLAITWRSLPLAAAAISGALCGSSCTPRIVRDPEPLAVPTIAAAVPAATPVSSPSAAPHVRPAAAKYLHDAEVAEAHGRLPAALAALETAARLSDSWAEPHRRLAALFRKARYLDRETDELETTLRLDPRDADAAFRLAEIYGMLQWAGKARERTLQATAMAPQDRRAYVILATDAYIRFQYAPMEAAAREGLQHYPGDPVLLAMQSESQRLQGRLLDAETTLRQAELAAASRQQREACEVGLARLLLDAKWKPPRYHDAEQAARSALRMAPDDPEAHYWLGVVLEDEGRPREAIPHYQVAAKANPDFESVALRLGRLDDRFGTPAEKAAAARLLALYNARMQNDTAFNDARDDVRDHGDAEPPHRMMAAQYLQHDQLPEAVMEAREALRMSPGDAAARQTLISALRRSGRDTEAALLASRQQVH